MREEEGGRERRGKREGKRREKRRGGGRERERKGGREREEGEGRRVVGRVSRWAIFFSDIFSSSQHAMLLTPQMQRVSPCSL